ncbi:MAG TPA: hypothetical protein VNG13_04030 [Mycobacteriales bacterium]|nr:hypothetical protein [Mycobacteriales bacterium]
MFAVVHLVVVADLADVCGVAQQPQHGLVAPQPAVAGAPAGVVEPVRDGGGAKALLDVGGEDGLHDGGFLGIGEQGFAGRVVGVAVGAGAGEPLAAGGLAGEAFGDPVDEQTAFELGEDAEQLQQHPTDRALGVDRFGGRAQREPEAVEVFDDGHQPDDGAGEPVDAVDQQHVELAGPGRGQRGLQAGARQGGAGGLVDEAVADDVAGLGGDEGVQSAGLGFQRVGLVDLVGGDPGQGGDPHRPGPG